MKQRKEWKRFLKEEEASGVVEMILIILILIIVATIFRDKLKEIVENLMKKVKENASAV